MGRIFFSHIRSMAQGMEVSRYTTFIQTEKSQPLWGEVCHEIFYRFSRSSEDESDWCWCSSLFPSGVIMTLIFVAWSKISSKLMDELPWKFGTHIHAPLRIHCKLWWSRLLLPSTDPSFNLSNTLFYVLIPAKLWAFPSTVLCLYFCANEQMFGC